MTPLALLTSPTGMFGYLHHYVRSTPSVTIFVDFGEGKPAKFMQMQMTTNQLGVV
jgi:hypothetical protein